MNIAIVEMLRKANEESNMILKNTPEQSLKRRLQVQNYNYKREGIISRLITSLKSLLFF